METLNHLFSPVSIGTMDLPCRLVMPPMATNFATAEGFVTERQMDYYQARARGGVGYITVEHTGILDQGKASPFMLMIGSDAHTESLSRLVDAVHGAGRKIVVQINHAGRQTASAVTGQEIVGPSPVPCPTRTETPHELTAPEIAGLTEAFAEAAGRVRAAGADGVEVHMAHGYLLCSFLSPFSNRRSDEYGGELEGRARFPVETLRAVRARVGSDFPVVCRLSGDEYVEGGLTVDDTRRIAGILAAEGADALHISACNAASGYLNHPPYYVEEGVFVHLAEAVKSEVDIPVIAVGRIRNPVMADEVIREGRADLVSMGRALIADPDLPRKAEEGRFDDITPCISCNNCIKTLRQGPVGCSVNPEVGHERRFRMRPADKSRRVWVVGGGPGGLKAAEIAARRGHKVTLFEKTDRLGGRLRLAAIPPHKAVINQFLDHLERTVRGLDVDLNLGRFFEADQVGEDGPEAVIVATGALAAPPPFRCDPDSEYMTVDQLLETDPERIGPRVVVIGGGGIGAETADYLSDLGKEVMVLEMLDDIAADLVGHLKHYLTLRLRDKGVTLMTSTKVEELGRDFVEIVDASGRRRIENPDTVVLATGGRPDDRILDGLKGLGAEIHVIGDAREARGVMEALYEAEETAFAI